MYKIHAIHVFLVFMHILHRKISMTFLGRVLLDLNPCFSRINYYPKESGLDP
jgi:hypothetical protein